jgi:hypothetical protein
METFQKTVKAALTAPRSSTAAQPFHPLKTWNSALLSAQQMLMKLKQTLRMTTA